MTSDLLRAVERLRIGADEQYLDEHECMNTMGQQRPTERAKRDTQALKKELETDFLLPRTSFDGKWLHKLQQYVVH